MHMHMHMRMHKHLHMLMLMHMHAPAQASSRSLRSHSPRCTRWPSYRAYGRCLTCASCSASGRRGWWRCMAVSCRRCMHAHCTCTAMRTATRTAMRARHCNTHGMFTARAATHSMCTAAYARYAACYTVRGRRGASPLRMHQPARGRHPLPSGTRRRTATSTCNPPCNPLRGRACCAVPRRSPCSCVG